MWNCWPIDVHIPVCDGNWRFAIQNSEPLLEVRKINSTECIPCSYSVWHLTPMYTYLHTCTHKHTHTHNTYTYKHCDTNTHTFNTCTHLRTHAHVHVQKFMYIYICTYVHTVYSASAYTYIRTYIHMHIVSILNDRQIYTYINFGTCTQSYEIMASLTSAAACNGCTWRSNPMWLEWVWKWNWLIKLVQTRTHSCRQNLQHIFNQK